MTTNERGGAPDETRAKLSVEGAREARERMSRVYPGWGHAPVTVPSVPTYGKCCEEAQLTAAELARRNEELSQARRLRRSAEDDANWYRDLALKADRTIEEAEAERDELQAKLDDPYSEVNQKAAAWDRVEAHSIIGPLSSLPEGDSYAERVCKRLDQLADMEATINELQPAENRTEGAGSSRKENGSADSPTLDRGAVENVVNGATCGQLSWDEVTYISSEIMALAPAEGWPEWLGPKIDPDDYEVTRDEEWNYLVDGAVFARDGDTADEVRRRSFTSVPNLAKREKVARLIESEQAATGDEDQQVGVFAERAAEALVETILDFFNVEDSGGAARATARAIVRKARDAGWTPPESEDEK